MDAELAVNLFSEQFCGHLLEELQGDDDQSLPNIPIADLGDLDINISQPQNGGLHWTNNNNDNNEMLPLADNSRGEVRPQYETGMKRQFESTGDLLDDGKREIKFTRTAPPSSDVTSLLNRDNSLAVMNRDTNLTLMNSLVDRLDNELNSQIASGDDTAIDGTPTIMGSFAESFASTKREVMSVAPKGSADSPVSDGKIYNSEATPGEITEPGISATMDPYQQVQMSSAATTESRRDNGCDNKLDPLPAIMEPIDKVQHPDGTVCHPRGQSKNDKKREQLSNEGHQEKSDETRTQTFLDWAMENLLKSADSLLELQNERDEKVSSSTESVILSRDDSIFSDTKASLNKGQHDVKQKTNNSSQAYNQIQSSGNPPFHIQKCILCLLCFKNNDHLLTHLKQSHSSVDCFQCPQCAAKLDDLELLEDHMKVHSLISNISTDDDVQLETSTDHISCEICHALFQSRQTLQEHRSTHHKVGDHPELSDYCLPEKSQNELSKEPKNAQELTTTEAITELSSSHEVTGDITNCSIVDTAERQLPLDLKEQAAKEPTSLAANTSIQHNSTGTHVYSEDDFLNLNFKREYSEEQDKEAIITENRIEKLNSTFCSNLNGTAVSQNLDHDNADNLQNGLQKNYTNNPCVNQSDLVDITVGILPALGPETDTEQTGYKSKGNEENGNQQDISGQKILRVSADNKSRKENTGAENTSDLISDRNGGASLSDNLNDFKHDDGQVLLCNNRMSVSKVSSVFKASGHDDKDIVTDIPCRNGDITNELPNIGYSRGKIFPNLAQEINTIKGDGVDVVEHVDTTNNLLEEIPTDNSINAATLLSAITESSTVSSYPTALSSLHIKETVTEIMDVFLNNEDNQTNVPNDYVETKGDDLKFDDGASHIQNNTTDPIHLQEDSSTKGTTPLVQNWVQLTESKTVIPPHMPNYTTYKCLTCAISFMSEDVLSRHCEGHTKPKKRSKKKRAKGKKKSRKTDVILQSGGNISQTGDNTEKDNRKKKKVPPVIVNYAESDHDEDEDITLNKDNEIENPQVVNNSLWSKHVLLLQEYL